MNRNDIDNLRRVQTQYREELAAAHNRFQEKLQDAFQELEREEAEILRRMRLNVAEVLLESSGSLSSLIALNFDAHPKEESPAQTPATPTVITSEPNAPAKRRGRPPKSLAVEARAEEPETSEPMSTSIPAQTTLNIADDEDTF